MRSGFALVGCFTAFLAMLTASTADAQFRRPPPVYRAPPPVYRPPPPPPRPVPPPVARPMPGRPNMPPGPVIRPPMPSGGAIRPAPGGGLQVQRPIQLPRPISINRGGGTQPTAITLKPGTAISLKPSIPTATTLQKLKASASPIAASAPRDAAGLRLQAGQANVTAKLTQLRATFNRAASGGAGGESGGAGARALTQARITSVLREQFGSSVKATGPASKSASGIGNIFSRHTLLANRLPIERVRTYSGTTSGPLKLLDSKSFAGGVYTEAINKQPMKLYRVWGGSAAEFRSFWTTQKPRSRIQVREKLALDSTWGNTATRVTEITIPAGTKFFVGHAERQGTLAGGGPQVYFSTKVEEKWKTGGWNL
jgi:hypothetical protein